jgi:hypothetical protein
MGKEGKEPESGNTEHQTRSEQNLTEGPDREAARVHLDGHLVFWLRYHGDLNPVGDAVLRGSRLGKFALPLRLRLLLLLVDAERLFQTLPAQVGIAEESAFEGYGDGFTVLLAPGTGRGFQPRADRDVHRECPFVRVEHRILNNP